MDLLANKLLLTAGPSDTGNASNLFSGHVTLDFSSCRPWMLVALLAFRMWENVRDILWALVEQASRIGLEGLHATLGTPRYEPQSSVGDIP